MFSNELYSGSASYAWKITKANPDVFGEDAEREATVYGPIEITKDQRAVLDKGLKAVHQTSLHIAKFRMKDDDGIIYYWGTMIYELGDELFAPLNDYGMPNAGCTSIEYRENGEWVVL